MNESLELAQALLNAVVKLESKDTVLSFHEANRLRRIIAAALDISDQEVAEKMASYYRRHRSRLEAPDVRRETARINTIATLHPHGESGDWSDNLRYVN